MDHVTLACYINMYVNWRNIVSDNDLLPIRPNVKVNDQRITNKCLQNIAYFVLGTMGW